MLDQSVNFFGEIADTIWLDEIALRSSVHRLVLVFVSSHTGIEQNGNLFIEGADSFGEFDACKTNGSVIQKAEVKRLVFS